MTPELSREVGRKLGDSVVSSDDRERINAAVLSANTYDELPEDIRTLIESLPSVAEVFDELEDKDSAGVTAAGANGEEHTSGMIALVPDESSLDRLALEGGEPRDELHLTLLFLGDASEYDNAARKSLVDAVEHQLSYYSDDHTMQVEAMAFGVNYWNPAGDDPAWVLATGDRRYDDDDDQMRLQLGTMKQVVLDAIEYADLANVLPEQHSPWVPHVTIAYGTDTSIISDLEERLGDITFDRVRVAFGEEVTDIQLSKVDDDTLTADGQGEQSMAFHKVEDHPQCPLDTPWAVVRDENDAVEGCHATENEADDQIASLMDTSPNDDASGDNDNNGDSASSTESFASVMDDDINVDADRDAGWRGVLVVEGVTTGDGREFAPGALEWAELPLTLRWNKEDSHGGEMSTTVAVNVGKIDEIWRDDNGKIMASGVFNLGNEYGQQAYDLVKGEFLRGVSVDVDDISDADVELIFPDGGDGGPQEPGEDDEDDVIAIMMMPEKMIFHAGRIRAATLVDIPAFVEAYIELTNGDDSGEMTADTTVASGQSTFGAVGIHHTGTSDASWDGSANEKRLPTPMPESKARAAYAWIDQSAKTDEGLPKSACKFIHHEVSADGNVGAANLTACSAGIAALNGARGGTTIPTSDRRGVYNHLAAHLKDANREPPPANFMNESMLVAAAAIPDDRPPLAWFQNPKLSLPTGITVSDDGRVYGHAAMWGECHVGHMDVCVTPPFEDYHPYFTTGEVVCADGSRVAVGQITLGTSHASLGLGASRASEHYDNTGVAVADVSIGNDDHGIWVAGAVRPDVPMNRVRDLRASGQVSGDWRRIGGELRLVGLLAVNVPGFPVPKLQTRVASGQPLALVAAGRPTFTRPVESADDLNKRAMMVMRDRLKQRVQIAAKN